MALPTSILLKSNTNNKYLRYSKVRTDVSHLRFSQDGDEEMSDIKYLKFEIKSANVEGLVHIRATYNNKYLVRKSAESNYLVAEASEPEEDQTKWSSTLFKPILLDSNDPKKIRLVHIDQLGEHYACLSRSEGDIVLRRDEASSATDDDDVFMLYDADSVVILPDYVAFVASNGNIGTFGNDLDLMMFEDNNSVAKVGVPQMVHQYPLKRLVQFTDMSNQVRWSLAGANGHYAVQAAEYEGSIRASFVPIKLDDNAVAFYCPDQNLYLNLNTERRDKGLPLCVDVSRIDSTARFRLEEPVLDRKVTDVTYDLDNCRIYDAGSAELFSDSYSNYGSEDQTHKFIVEYTKSWTTSWKDSGTLSFNGKISFTAGIPKVDSMGVDVTVSASMECKWGEKVTDEGTISYEYPVLTPPGKKVVLRVITSTASCDAPFKCIMRDTLHDGTAGIRAKEGVFTGANQYCVEAELREYDLTEAEILAHKQSSNTD